LQVVGPMAPGSPLCRVHSESAAIDRMEITFKGGQVGRENFFSRVLRGQP
jgi:3-oxoisoapionate kinase